MNKKMIYLGLAGLLALGCAEEPQTPTADATQQEKADKTKNGSAKDSSGQHNLTPEQQKQAQLKKGGGGPGGGAGSSQSLLDEKKALEQFIVELHKSLSQSAQGNNQPNSTMPTKDNKKPTSAKANTIPKSDKNKGTQPVADKFDPSNPQHRNNLKTQVAQIKKAADTTHKINQELNKTRQVAGFDPKNSKHLDDLIDSIKAAATAETSAKQTLTEIKDKLTTHSTDKHFVAGDSTTYPTLVAAAEKTQEDLTASQGSLGNIRRALTSRTTA
ncbi:MAG: hypothetical protein AAF310_05400, partial [Myxococcota bacterium]